MTQSVKLKEGKELISIGLHTVAQHYMSCGVEDEDTLLNILVTECGRLIGRTVDDYIVVEETETPQPAATEGAHIINLNDIIAQRKGGVN